MCLSVALANASLTRLITVSSGNFVIGCGSPLARYWFLKFTYNISSEQTTTSKHWVQTYLIVEEWHDETCCSASCTTLFTFVASHGIERIYSSFPLRIKSSNNCVNVVREKSFSIEHSLCKTCHGRNCNRTIMCVMIPLLNQHDKPREFGKPQSFGRFS
jgi:hypothetical protein